MKIEFDMTTKLPGQPMQRDHHPYEQDEEMQMNPDFMDMDMMNMDQNKYKNGEEMQIDELEFENPEPENPELKHNDMDLAKRDQYLLKIEDEIQLRRRFLLEKQKKL